MQMRDHSLDVRPGQAIFNGDQIIGFMWKWDPDTTTCDVVLFEPVDLTLLPHQTFVAETFEQPYDALADVLKADPVVLGWWRETVRGFAAAIN